jgi:hypothetical protein
VEDVNENFSYLRYILLNLFTNKRRRLTFKFLFDRFLRKTDETPLKSAEESSTLKSASQSPASSPAQFCKINIRKPLTQSLKCVSSV